jgi:hypothetical protein
MPKASGPFDVNLVPRSADEEPNGSTLARRAIEKQFHGDLSATSNGEMLSAGTQTPGSAGYVAIERVTGTLHGRRGSFVLQHSAMMNRGAPSLTITVVPDSGTGELAGLSGTMAITIADKKHSYDFDYIISGNM